MNIEVKHLTKKYSGKNALLDISFRIGKGNLIAILGPSGSGKTSLLRMLAGLTAPDYGDIYFDHKKVNDMTPQERHVGFVFQNYALFRHSTVFENIVFGLEAQKITKTEKEQRVNRILSLTELNGLEHRYPHQLSGGQCQRVAFARALAPAPRILLLDEPFAAIDAKLRKELRCWLRKTVDVLGLTTLLVTHDQEEATEIADEMIIIEQGRLVQQGSPFEIYKRPRTPFVASFISESYAVDDIGSLGGFENRPIDGTALIRPENVEVERDRTKLSHPEIALQGMVRKTYFRGAYWKIEIAIDRFAIFGSYPADKPPIHAGEEVFVIVHRVYMLNEASVSACENELITATKGR